MHLKIISEKNWTEIYTILVSKPTKLAQKHAILYEADTFV